ncbi:MAG: response regulator transcription factor [Flavobacteriales bacterium]|nr:response regulator transcription factor [Flavobacteriales bacterium]MBP9080176.1 response regulator transcription factor [Flavobacteriales bacterium]
MDQPASPLRIVLCDDHRIITESLQRILLEAPSMQCAGIASNGTELLGLLAHTKADLVLLDLNMPGMDGAETLRRIKQRWPSIKVLILTMEDGPATVKHLMDHGADGYMLKTSGSEELLLAVQEASKGRRQFSPGVAEALLGQRTRARTGPLAQLSERELEVLAALAEGLSNKEVGDKLFISPRTVDTHRTNIMKKLEVHNLAGLVRLAIAAGLVR